MRRIVGAIIVVVMLVLGAGMLVPAIMRDRAAADRARCQEHLRRLAVQGIGEVVQSTKVFPAGTVVVRDLPPERRLSWLAPLLLQVGHDELRQRLDMTVAWDSAPNLAVAQNVLTIAQCPAAKVDQQPQGFAPLHFVGSGGIGPNAANLAPDQPGAGVFRFHAETPIAAVKDGISNCVMLIETGNRPGPWLAGGPASVRTLDPTAQTYIGIGFAFGGHHPSGANAAFADGSVRFLDASIEAHVFRQIIAIADGSQ